MESAVFEIIKLDGFEMEKLQALMSTNDRCEVLFAVYLYSEDEMGRTLMNGAKKSATSLKHGDTVETPSGNTRKPSIGILSC